MDAFRIWEQGIDLTDADYHFAPDRLRRAYDVPKPVPQPGLIKAWSKVAARMGDERGKETVLAGVQAVDRIFGTFSARAGASIEMRDQLLQWLGQGKLIAYGFSIPRRTVAIPDRIPVDLFQDRFVNWKESAINGAGLEFVSVRVVHHAWIGETEAQFLKLLPAPVKSQQVGRPPSREPIAIAVRALIDDGVLPNDDRQKRNIDAVRKRVHRLFPGQFPRDKGLGREAIRKILVEELTRVKSGNHRDQKL